MPSAVRGAASPWFTGAGSDLLVTTCELKVTFKLQLTDHGQTTNRNVLVLDPEHTVRLTSIYYQVPGYHFFASLLLTLLTGRSTK